MGKKAMDVVTEEMVDAEKTEENQEVGQDEHTSENVDTRLQQMDELVDHYKNETSRWKTEAQNAFTSRDRAKAKLRQKEDKGEQINSTDYQKHIDSLQKELKEKEDKINSFEHEKEKNKKMKIVMEISKEAGVKERYLDKLDRFLNLDEIIPGKEASSIRYQLDTVKNNFPDLFGASGKELEDAFPAPNFRTDGSIEHYKQEYAKEHSKGLDADPEKLMKLYDIIKEA